MIAGHSGRTVSVLTLLGHPDFQALLQPTVLAAVAGDFVDDAVLLPVTSVHHVFLDASPKETLRDRHDGEIRREDRCWWRNEYNKGLDWLLFRKLRLWVSIKGHYVVFEKKFKLFTFFYLQH